MDPLLHTEEYLLAQDMLQQIKKPEVEIVDPRRSATDEISAVFERYPHIGSVLPAISYYSSQLEALAQTINASSADVVVSGTPSDLGALIKINKPILRASYEFSELEEPGLGGLIDKFLRDHKLF